MTIFYLYPTFTETIGDGGDKKNLFTSCVLKEKGQERFTQNNQCLVNLSCGFYLLAHQGNCILKMFVKKRQHIFLSKYNTILMQ